uniref:Uncharacterized protein n=1 Tax=Glossina palpalis gambiensis TaxID=67801 RepID=A0A1B0AM39_9MUSC
MIQSEQHYEMSSLAAITAIIISAAVENATALVLIAKALTESKALITLSFESKNLFRTTNNSLKICEDMQK